MGKEISKIGCQCHRYSGYYTEVSIGVRVLSPSLHMTISKLASIMGVGTSVLKE